MAITKAFGYKVRCDMTIRVPGGPSGTLKEVQCEEVILVLVPRHTGKYGGKAVFERVLTNGFNYNMETKMFSCPGCFEQMEVNAGVVHEKKPILYDGAGRQIN